LRLRQERLQRARRRDLLTCGLFRLLASRSIPPRCELLAVRAEEKGLELVVDYGSDVPSRVVGDEGRIRQVLTNLVGNAVKFTPRGYVLLQVAQRASSAQEALLRITVTDTGIGIAPEQLSKLFQKFVQADATTTRRYGGTGLGLAIARHLVELMGGRLGASSEPGHGSAFWFELTLPLGSAEPAVDVPRPELRRARVLIVDDNEANRNVLAGYLAGWGLRHDVVAGGAEALEWLTGAVAEGDPYTIALIDYLMPGLDGLQLAARIRAIPELAGTALIALSSIGHLERSRFAEAGFAAFLVKPVRQCYLLSALVEVFGQVAKEILAPRAWAPPLAVEPEPPHPRISARVLVVEDNQANQLVASKLLEATGCRVDVAGNGKEALEMLEVVCYDLVFMDCQMPEMDGYEATSIIRCRQHIPPGATPAGVQIVGLTAAVPSRRDGRLSDQTGAAEALRRGPSEVAPGGWQGGGRPRGRPGGHAEPGARAGVGDARDAGAGRRGPHGRELRGRPGVDPGNAQAGSPGGGWRDAGAGRSRTQGVQLELWSEAALERLWATGRAGPRGCAGGRSASGRGAGVLGRLREARAGGRVERGGGPSEPLASRLELGALSPAAARRVLCARAGGLFSVPASWGREDQTQRRQEMLINRTFFASWRLCVLALKTGTVATRRRGSPLFRDAPVVWGCARGSWVKLVGPASVPAQEAAPRLASPETGQRQGR
ncbi:MAG: response regulator, partial [Candidatus Riflebacteria bacterium]|nr:response regulator [Candidatus Riflebacteria bacterium]